MSFSVEQFMPSVSGSTVKVNDFVLHVREMMINRREQRETYSQILLQRQQAAIRAGISPVFLRRAGLNAGTFQIDSYSDDDSLPQPGSSIPDLPSNSTSSSSSTSRRRSSSLAPRSQRPTQRQRLLPLLESFTESPQRQSVVVSILSLARSEGWDNTLIHGTRIGWFRRKIDLFFGDGGILSAYRRCSDTTLRRKFKLAENMTRGLYNQRGRQPDTTGDLTEAHHPLFVRHFFEYFDFLSTHQTNQQAAQRAK